MKIRPFLEAFAVIGLLMLVAVFVGGCGASPVQKVLAAEQLYTTNANSLADSIRDGLITDHATLNAIDVAKDEADKELDAAKAAAVNGDKLGWQFAWSRASRALDRFLLLVVKKTAKPKETTWISPSPSQRFDSSSPTPMPLVA